MFRFTKKRAIVMAVVGSLALSVGAYAYFTSTGSGTGSATVGTSSQVTIARVGTIAPLYPGTSSPIVVTATNPGPGTQRVNGVHLASVSTGGAVGCAPEQFTMNDISIGETLPANSTSTEKTGSLVMQNGSEQDSCKGATLTLYFTSY